VKQRANGLPTKRFVPHPVSFGQVLQKGYKALPMSGASQQIKRCPSTHPALTTIVEDLQGEGHLLSAIGAGRVTTAPDRRSQGTQDAFESPGAEPGATRRQG